MVLAHQTPKMKMITVPVDINVWALRRLPDWTWDDVCDSLSQFLSLTTRHADKPYCWGEFIRKTKREWIYTTKEALPSWQSSPSDGSEEVAELTYTVLPLDNHPDYIAFLVRIADIKIDFL